MTNDMDRHSLLSGAAVTQDQLRKAQRSCARNAVGRAELLVFLNMLGIHPGQENPLWITEKGDAVQGSTK